MNLRDDDRNKAVKLLIKILSKIINNPTQTQKYGNLHTKKMMEKFAKCNPAGDLLLLSGFEFSNDKKRLIWKNTTNNMMKLKYIHTTLSTMIDSSLTTNTSPSIGHNNTDRSQNHTMNSILQNALTQPPINNPNSVKISTFVFIPFTTFHLKHGILDVNHLLWKKCKCIRNYHIGM